MRVPVRAQNRRSPRVDVRNFYAWQVGSSFPASLALLYAPKSQSGATKSLKGVAPTWSYVGDMWAGLVNIGQNPPYHAGKGVWVGPAADSTMLPDDVPDGVTMPSAASTSGGNGLAWEMDTKLRECFEKSETDGVELVQNGGFDEGIEGWTVTVTGGNSIAAEDGAVRFICSGSDTAILLQSKPIIGGALYRIEFDVLDGSSGMLKIVPFDAVGEYLFNCTPGHKSFLLSAGYTDSRIRLLRVVGQVANALIDNISIQRLLPATCTVAAVVTAGASSAETTADSNILTGRDTVASLLYFASGGVIKSNDGTTAASVTVTDGWDAGQKFLIVIEYGPTTYRVGYLKVGAETALTFGDAASSDGSYNPLTHIRAALTSTLPLHLGGIQTWEEAATLADITKYFKQAGVL